MIVEFLPKNGLAVESVVEVIVEFVTPEKVDNDVDDGRDVDAEDGRREEETEVLPGSGIEIDGRPGSIVGTSTFGVGVVNGGIVMGPPGAAITVGLEGREESFVSPTTFPDWSWTTTSNTGAVTT